MNQQVAIPDPGSAAGPEIIVFDEGASKGAIISELASRIPQNEYGLPQFFFRSDMIHGTQIAEDEIDAAAVGLFYYDGYPVLANGSSFWNQLPHEPQVNFELFQAYLDQADDIGIRQLDLLSTSCKAGLAELVDMSREFFWSSRAYAYDLFIVAAEAKKRQNRIRKMEDGHFGKANALFDSLMKRFEGEFEDWTEELNAKEAIEVLESLVKIQRMSVGLTGQHASSTARDIAPGESSAAVIRKLAQGAGATQAGADSFAARLQSLLDNPEEGATIQAAILQFTSPHNKSTFSEDFG